jgi:hypothetical protein
MFLPFGNAWRKESVESFIFLFILDIYHIYYKDYKFVWLGLI